MFAREASIVINAPAAPVYQYVSDVQRHSEWAAQKLDPVGVDQTDPAKPTSARFVVHVMGTRGESDVKVIEAIPPHRLVYDCIDMSGHYRWSFVLVEDGSATKLTHRLERLSAPMWVRLVQPWFLYPFVGSPGLRTGLANIKAHMEGGAARPHE